MNDWFVLITPLLMLPIVLLFAFLGCALETDHLAVPLPLTLEYGPDFQPDIKGISVDFEWTTFPPGSDVWVEAGKSTAFIGSSIDPSGGIIVAVSDIPLSYRAEISCRCSLTTEHATEHTLPKSIDLGPVHNEKEADETPPLFYVGRDGDAFHFS